MLGKNWKLIVLVVGALVAAVSLLRACPGRRLAGSSLEREYTYRCGSCAAMFTMTDAKIRRLERRGRVKEPPNAYKQYECGACGEISATYYEERTYGPR